ncbi:MAG TPA: glycoside hydrolase family 16 protein [Verrucomicrobiae bacterium]|jgi:beta-glucanase (GH16 family)|nr:glycoside hydrolase family 16 protein [Verrucomicrobiae bacterium]
MKFLCALVLSALAWGGAAWAQSAPTVPAWNLIWADEFDQPDGTSPDPARWTFDIGGNGWGNSELEYYTARTNNARIVGGNLIIEADKETYTGSDRTTRAYTSARLKTQNLASWTYGRFEARIQIPFGQGIWPAFWTLGNTINSAGWPACGELDIMENIGREPTTVHGTAHGPGYSSTGITFQRSTLPIQAYSAAYHLYAVQWAPGIIQFLVDNKIYGTITSNSIPPGGQWVFASPEFLLLNVAVGGQWPGNPDSTTTFPQFMKVDYVRVYAATQAPAPVLSVTSSGTNWVAHWDGRFPHATLQYSASFPPQWGPVEITGARSGDEFLENIKPGYYRLQ